MSQAEVWQTENHSRERLRYVNNKLYLLELVDDIYIVWTKTIMG